MFFYLIYTKTYFIYVEIKILVVIFNNTLLIMELISFKFKKCFLGFIQISRNIRIQKPANAFIIHINDKYRKFYKYFDTPKSRILENVYVNTIFINE